MSPVVGATLLIVVVILLAAVSGGILLGLAEETPPPPNAVLELERGEFSPVHVLRHEGGDSLGGDGRTEIRGIANPDALHDTELGTGDREEVVPIVPTDEKIRIVWYANNTDDTGYVIWEGTATSYLEVTPDEGCGWVEERTNNGTDPITVDGIVVTCDIVTEGGINLVNDAVVVGEVNSTQNNVDIDEASVYGHVSADGDVDLDGANVSGSVTAAGNDVVVTDESTVGGDVHIASGNVDIDGGSVIGEDVYVLPGSFSCSNATVNDQDCGSYEPKDADSY